MFLPRRNPLFSPAVLAAALALLTLPGCGMPAGSEMMWIGLIALLLFGGAKLPGLMRGLGSGIHEFKKGLKEGEDDDKPKEIPEDKSDAS